MKNRGLKELINLPGIEEADITRHDQSVRLSFHKNNGYELCFSYSGIFTWEMKDGRLIRIRGNQMSQTNIFNLFKEYAGQSPNDYIQYLRCRRACDLLSSTDNSVTDIAYILGFSSSQYFSQVFKKYTGFTPGGYRRL